MLKSQYYSKSAGLIITKGRRILLVKPSNCESDYSFPKGEVHVHETEVEAAIRETFEEVGILVSVNDVNETPIVINYVNDGILCKTVYLFKLNVQITNYPDIIPTSMIQQSEIEAAFFLEFEEALLKVHWRFRKIVLDLLILNA